MIGALLRRTATALLLAALVVGATFFLLHLAPGDPALLSDDPRLTPEQREHLRRLWGLDRPLLVQLGDWFAAVIRGDWGTSFLYRRPVLSVIAEALPATLLLGGAALLLQWLIGLPLGILVARRPGGRLDALVRVGSLGVYAIPTFWLALMALMVFAYRLPLFPASHMHDAAAPAGSLAAALDLLHHLALPSLVLAVSAAGAVVRFVRSGMLDVLPTTYLTAARAHGVAERRVLWIHALRSASGPLLQILGLSLPVVLSGALVTEVVFAWPGIGQITYAALLGRDYPLILAGTAWSALLVVLGNLAADVLLAVADPRAREAI